MYNYKARIYSPTFGWFLQADPIGYAEGMNWYNYAGGDPVNQTDPARMRQVWFPDPTRPGGGTWGDDGTGSDPGGDITTLWESSPRADWCIKPSRASLPMAVGESLRTNSLVEGHLNRQ